MFGNANPKSLARIASLSLALTAATLLAGFYYGSYAALQDTQWRSIHRDRAAVTSCVPCQSSERLAGISIRIGVVGLVATIRLTGLAARSSRSRRPQDE